MAGKLKDSTVSGRGEAATRSGSEYSPRTELGRRLWAIRQKMIASGAKLLSWDEVEREVAERRGEAGGPSRRN